MDIYIYYIPHEAHPGIVDDRERRRKGSSSSSNIRSSRRGNLIGRRSTLYTCAHTRTHTLTRTHTHTRLLSSPRVVQCIQFRLHYSWPSEDAVAMVTTRQRRGWKRRRGGITTRPPRASIAGRSPAAATPARRPSSATVSGSRAVIRKIPLAVSYIPRASSGDRDRPPLRRAHPQAAGNATAAAAVVVAARSHADRAPHVLIRARQLRPSRAETARTPSLYLNRPGRPAEETAREKSLRKFHTLTQARARSYPTLGWSSSFLCVHIVKGINQITSITIL